MHSSECYVTALLVGPLCGLAINDKFWLTISLVNQRLSNSLLNKLPV